MIGFFPEPYPDELVYSWLARYYAHSGYMGYSYVAEDLFVHKWNRPDVEFVTSDQLGEIIENSGQHLWRL